MEAGEPRRSPRRWEVPLFLVLLTASVAYPAFGIELWMPMTAHGIEVSTYLAVTAVLITHHEWAETHARYKLQTIFKNGNRSRRVPLPPGEGAALASTVYLIWDNSGRRPRYSETHIG